MNRVLGLLKEICLTNKYTRYTSDVYRNHA